MSPPVLKPGSASLSGDQENVDEAKGVNLCWEMEQVVQLFCGRMRAWEPVSMRTELYKTSSLMY